MSSKQIAIVTGASSGIGRRIARGLPARYSLDELWVIARSGDKLRALREELSIPVRALPFDLTKEESISALRTLLKEEQPAIKILVNASGYGKFERFDRIAETDAAGIPVFGSEIEQVTLGCVAAEGLDYVALGVQTGKMAAKVLKGEAEAADIPYETIEESALYVNTDACEALGVTIPEDLMARATDMADAE